jgi:hypothetical protein
MKEVYVFDDCKKRTDCKRCDIGYVLKNYVKPLMQTLTNDVRNFYMKLLTTKCLNTAVMLSIFMLGKRRGIEIANFCDTVKTRKRHLDHLDDTKQILSQFQKDIQSQQFKHREFYYVLLTDGSFPYADTKTSSAYFPGHVFILEKIPSDPPTFYMYQSYINKYDLNEHVQKNRGSLKISQERVNYIIDTLDYILHTDVWDDECVRRWKKMTFVDTGTMRGSLCKNRFFLCIRKARVTDCLKHIQMYTKAKLQEIEKVPFHQRAGQVYGDINLYDKTQKPLTMSEMYVQLKHLYDDVKQKKVSLTTINVTST